MKSTIITMFFDLKSLPDASDSLRPIEFYLEKGRKTLELEYPMVIFCDEKTKPQLESIRGSRPTEYVIKNITEYDFFKRLHPKVVENRKVNPTTDSRNTASYFLTSMFKIHALWLSYKNNYFPDSTHYTWVDLGGSHIMRGFPEAVNKLLDNPREKIGVCYIHYRSKNELYPVKERNGIAGNCGIAAGILTAQKEYIEEFHTKMFELLDLHISLGVGHAEEQIMTYCHSENPHLFTLHYGDYYSIATNYHRTVEDLQCVKFNFILNAHRYGRQDLVNSAVQSISS
jgi:hypothetical protein